MADAELEAGRLAARQLAQPLDELQQLDRRAELAVTRRAHAILAGPHTARRCDLGRHLRARQHAAVPRLRALAQLDLDHLDLRVGRIRDEALLAEAAMLVAATEVARGRLPRSGRRHACDGRS